MSRPDDEDFLGRWSARKLKAQARPEPEPEVAPAPPAAPPRDVAPEKTDAEILEELGLPDPDSLLKGDDFKAFLGAGIPARLRARALRRLWRSDPVLANLDGLNDYEQDFTDAATVRPDLKTVYRVGKGLLREPPKADAAEGAAPAPSRPVDSPEDNDPEAVADGRAETAPDGNPPAEGDTPTEPAGPPAADDTPREASAAAGLPRRMRFRFDG